MKWVAGMASWVERVQSYDEGGWNYYAELRKFVDEGMNDDDFIKAVSGVLNHGCHDCKEEVSGAWERRNNFKQVRKYVSRTQETIDWT